MKHVKITNKSRWNIDELTPLLRVAFNSAKDEFKRPCDKHTPFRLVIGRTRTNTWHMATNTDAATISFSDPGVPRGVTSIGTQQCENMNEVIIATAAWAFAACKGAYRVAQACTRDAVLTYRAHKQEIDGQIAAVVQRRKDKAGDDFARSVFQDMERSSLEFKISKIEQSERVWQRKAKLAATKLKTLRRRKVALQAAEKRRLNREAKAPPTTQETQ